MKMTVVVPTYRRPQDLQRCLIALKQQIRPVDELLVIVRDDDLQTWNFLDSFPKDNLPLQTVTVTVPGVVAAMNAALEVAHGDTISFTDDDAQPYEDWLSKIETHFLADQQIGGVGGKDCVYHGQELEQGEQEVVGKLLWFGKVIGNHHIGVGSARYVDVLKGVNMSFRTQAIKELKLKFDQRLRGTGAQVHLELGFCLRLKRAGWQLIYDPEILVNHYVGERFDEDKRHQFNEIATSNAVHNETLAILEALPPLRRFIFYLWGVLVGTREALGLVQFFRFLPTEKELALFKLLASLKGRWQGLLTFFF